jgi:hypothetical protein
LQRKRLKNNNNPELGSERENTSKPNKSPKFRRGRKKRRPHKQTSSAFMELIFSLNHQNRHSRTPKKNTHTHTHTQKHTFWANFWKKGTFDGTVFWRKHFTK